MSQCNCVKPELPRDTIDLITPVYEAVGGRLYRLHFETKAAAIKLTDGQDVETRLAFFERALSGNTSIRFADSIAARDALGGLVPGDMCYVFDASADNTVPYGGAMYIWLPALSWKKCFHGDSPLDALNLIKDRGGLAVDKYGKVYVDFSIMPKDDLDRLLSQIIGTGGGLETGADGKLHLKPGDIAGSGLQTDANGKLTVKPSDLAGNGLAANGGKLVVNPADLAGAGLSVDGLKLIVDFETASASQLQTIVDALVQDGGGLGIDASGKIFVNFDTMPTNKFEAVVENFRKSLRLPKWLTKNTIFHVDQSHPGAADTLEEGRGIAADKPFKTIQACVDFVCENYNFSKYNIDIHVAAGTYAPFSVRGYTSAGGVLNIIGDAANKPVILGENTNSIVVDGATLYLLNLKLQVSITRSPASGIVTCYCLRAINRASVSCGAIDFLLTHQPGAGASTNNDILIQAASYATVILGYSTNATENYQNTIEFHQGDYGAITVLHATSNGLLYLMGSRVSETNAACPASGECAGFALADSSGMISFYGTYAKQFNFTVPAGKAVTGKRYAAENGGKIAVKNSGANFFPGSTAGTVEAETYSWYK